MNWPMHRPGVKPPSGPERGRSDAVNFVPRLKGTDRESNKIEWDKHASLPDEAVGQMEIRPDGRLPPANVVEAPELVVCAVLCCCPDFHRARNYLLQFLQALQRGTQTRPPLLAVEMLRNLRLS
jgi:hypothetical protein